MVDGELEQVLLSTLLLFSAASEQDPTNGQGAGWSGGRALEAGFRCTAIPKGREPLRKRESIVLVQAIAADPVAGFPELRRQLLAIGRPSGLDARPRWLAWGNPFWFLLLPLRRLDGLVVAGTDLCEALGWLARADNAHRHWPHCQGSVEASPANVSVLLTAPEFGCD